MKKIIIHSGKTISSKCDYQKHPADEVLSASLVVEYAANDRTIPEVIYSNSTDFVSAIKYIAKKHNVEVEFFLDGVSHGNDIEPLFADFNKSLDLINELGATEE